jgi:hypothetical protein
MNIMVPNTPADTGIELFGGLFDELSGTAVHLA